ncbi:MAG TPA: hypothetical protein VF621_12160 [Pyrinomonadaceae bacterium]|jgi:hypothetical protein
MATYFLFGEPDWPQVLFYIIVLLMSVGGFVFTAYFICAKVFGGRGARLLTISPDAAEGGADERR